MYRVETGGGGQVLHGGSFRLESTALVLDHCTLSTAEVKSSAHISEQRSGRLVRWTTRSIQRPIPGARRRAHAEVRAAIVSTASSHIAAEGAAALSLRAVARDLGMVSSAVYRYFASRDELLTALIVEAYDSLGATTESSIDATVGRPPGERWVTAAMTIRNWAHERPHDYALLYGTPVPGYTAPQDTTVPGTRVTRALIRIIADALREGRVDRAIA